MDCDWGHVVCRLIWRGVAGLLLYALSPWATATITASTGYGFPPSSFYATQTAACQFWANANGFNFLHVDMPGAPGAGTPHGHATSNAYGKCHACASGSACDTINDGNRSADLQSGGLYCPANSTLSGSTCACNSGYSELSGACVQSACPAAGTIHSSGYFDIGTNVNAFKGFACVNSCSMTFSGTVPAGTSLVGGVLHFFALGSFEYVGGTVASCPTGTNPVGSVSVIPTNTCGAGQQKGTVNGRVVCLNTSTGTPVPQTVQSTSSTSSQVTTNPDGSTTNTKTTDNPDGSKTTVTTTTQPNGSSTSTTTVVQSPLGGRLPPNSPVGSAAGNPSNKADENPTCGWPGGPPCKIDEAGTPSDGSLSSQKGDFETQAVARNSAIAALGSQGNHGLTWDWTWVLPSGTCMAMNYGVPGKMISLDPCEKLHMVRDLLGFALYIATALALLAIMTNSQSKG